MRVAILGLGLIGGSIARALAGSEDWSTSGWDVADAARDAARQGGAPDRVDDTAPAALEAAELVVLAAPPLANLDLVDELGPGIAAIGATCTDVSSVQSPVAARAAAVAGLRFVGGHPMSGREVQGYAASDGSLFEGRPWVVLPGPAAGPSDLQRVRALARACGAVPMELTAAAHDRAVATISGLPLLASAALVEAATHSPGWEVGRELAAQGWQGATRLARGDPGLGVGILAANAGPVAEALRTYRAVLDAWQARLDLLALSDSASAEEVRLALEAARESLAAGEET